MDQGKRMFYADPTTGETIPVSDDENEKVCISVHVNYILELEKALGHSVHSGDSLGSSERTLL